MKTKQAKRNKKWAEKQRKKQPKDQEETQWSKPSQYGSFTSKSTQQDGEDPPDQDPVIWNDENEYDDQENINGYPGHVIKNVEDDDGDDDDKYSKKKKKSGGFQSMGLSHPILKGILKRGYQVPTPIQRKTIPVILEGRDVVAMARTGSGKTAAFLIPLFEKLQYCKTSIGEQAKYPRALIISPTRELATQTVKFVRELGRYVDLKVVSVLGGDSMESQFAALTERPDVVVATPGRFMHLLVEMEMRLDGVQYVVFDEADRLFEMGFGEQITEILKRLPDDRQTVMFSATMPRVLVDFTKAGLHDPTLIRLDVDTKLPELLSLTHIACRTEEKLPVLLYLLKNEVEEYHQTIVFVATKHHVELLHAILDEAGISNCYIYSSLDASARKISLGKFRNGKANVMIVTDIAARGIDIPILDNVINFHFPAKPKLFMHRVGRVARAGRSGTAISIVAPDEISALLDLHLFLGKPLKFEANAAKDDGSVVLGKISQDMMDTEQSFLTNLVEVKSELESLFKVARNGYAQYLKSRPPASTESNKRAKGVDYSKLPFHSKFSSAAKEDPMVNFVSQIHNYRPRSTIFEIGPKAGSTTHQIMKTKRMKDQEFVEKHRTGKVIEPTNVVDMESAKKDEENFINYLPKDFHTETGLSVASPFDKQVQESVMDITGDDSTVLKNQRSLQKWDRKRKKFVTVGQDNKKSKKIKTESGTWISASYKSDRFKAWQEKTKTSQQDDYDDDDDGGSDGGGDSFARKGVDPSQRRPAFSKRLVKTGKNARPKAETKVEKGKRFKSELKRPEEILKARKVREAKQQKFDKSKKGGRPGKGGKGAGGFKSGGKGAGGFKSGGKGAGGFKSASKGAGGRKGAKMGFAKKKR